MTNYNSVGNFLTGKVNCIFIKTNETQVQIPNQQLILKRGRAQC